MWGYLIKNRINYKINLPFSAEHQGGEFKSVAHDIHTAAEGVAGDKVCVCALTGRAPRSRGLCGRGRPGFSLRGKSAPPASPAPV